MNSSLHIVRTTTPQGSHNQ